MASGNELKSQTVFLPAAACDEDAGRSEGEDVEPDRVRDVSPGSFV